MKEYNLKEIIFAIGLMLLFAPILYAAFSTSWLIGVVVLGIIIVLVTVE